MYAIAGYEVLGAFVPKYRFIYRKCGREVGRLFSVGTALVLVALGTGFLIPLESDGTIPRFLGIPILLGGLLLAIGLLIDKLEL